jgi:ACS family glucarate transporter-like MFS transporter
MLLSRGIWFLLIMYFCSNAGWSFFASWITPYLEGDLHLRGLNLALASGSPLFFGGIACFMGGFFTDRLVLRLGRRWGRTLIGAIGYAVAGTMMVVALKITTHHAPLALVALCVSSFSKDLAMPASWAMTIDIGHRYSGTVSGLMNSFGNTAQVISVVIVAHLAVLAGTKGHLNWQVSLYYYAAMFFISSVCFLFIDPRKVVVYSTEDRLRLESEGLLVR